MAETNLPQAIFCTTVKQTFFTERNTEEEKTKVFVSILDYFVKLNTRGKSFSLEETEELINKLNRR